MNASSVIELTCDDGDGAAVGAAGGVAATGTGRDGKGAGGGVAPGRAGAEGADGKGRGGGEAPCRADVEDGGGKGLDGGAATITGRGGRAGIGGGGIATELACRPGSGNTVIS